MRNRLVSTRFTTNPVVYKDAVKHRLMVGSPEMYETFINENGLWREGAFDEGDLKSNFVMLKDSREAWRIFKQALGQVGYL